MQTPDDLNLNDRLHYATHELGQVQHFLAKASDHPQTASDDVQVCCDGADIIDAAFDASKQQVQALIEEMDRVYALRNDESDLYLRHENSKLKKELALLQQAFCNERNEHQARLQHSIQSDEGLAQRIASLEQFNQFLKSKINQIKEMYEDAIIELADLKNKNMTSHNIPAFNLVANTAVSLANGGSTQVTIRPPGKPKAKPIVRGTPAANESFERMKRALFPSLLSVSTDVIKVDNNTTVDSLASTSADPVPITNLFDPVTPSQVKSKLNPAVAAFTPSNSSDKYSAKSGSAQTSSPNKNESKPSVTATVTEELHVDDNIKYQGAIATSAQNEFSKEAEPVQDLSLKPRTLPHLRRLNIPTNDKDILPSLVQPSDKGKNKETTVHRVELFPHLTSITANGQAATTPATFVAMPDPVVQAWLDDREKAQSHKTSSQAVDSMTSDRLIEIDSESPQSAKKKKAATLPPGFNLFSANDDAPAKSESAARINPYGSTSPLAVSDNPTAKKDESAVGHKVPTQLTTEKERDAVSLAAYTEVINALSQKYRKPSRDSSDDKEDEIATYNPPEDYNPPKPTGSHILCALLDEECRKMILKPRAVKVEGVMGQEWTAVRKDGKVVYVL